jgi:hypothetical protein
LKEKADFLSIRGADGKEPFNARKGLKENDQFPSEALTRVHNRQVAGRFSFLGAATHGLIVSKRKAI